MTVNRLTQLLAAPVRLEAHLPILTPGLVVVSSFPDMSLNIDFGLNVGWNELAELVLLLPGRVNWWRLLGTLLRLALALVPMMLLFVMVLVAILILVVPVVILPIVRWTLLRVLRLDDVRRNWLLDGRLPVNRLVRLVGVADRLVLLSLLVSVLVNRLWGNVIVGPVLVLVMPNGTELGLSGLLPARDRVVAIIELDIVELVGIALVVDLDVMALEAMALGDVALDAVALADMVVLVVLMVLVGVVPLENLVVLGIPVLVLSLVVLVLVGDMAPVSIVVLMGTVVLDEMVSLELGLVVLVVELVVNLLVAAAPRGGNARDVVVPSLLICPCMAVVSTVVAGLLVCRLRTLLIDTLVILGLRPMALKVHLNRLGMINALSIGRLI